jgi:hypothetical protein
MIRCRFFDERASIHKCFGARIPPQGGSSVIPFPHQGNPSVNSEAQGQQAAYARR